MSKIFPVAPSVAVSRPVTAASPREYNVYEDDAGNQYVLTREKLSGQVWFALKIQTLSIVLLSSSNLSRLQLIGRATIQA